MQHKFIVEAHNSRLIILFAGWAMDFRPFMHLNRPGYDILAVWDYRSHQMDWSIVAQYKEICIVAWSLGVYAASIAAVALAPKVTLKLAVNGTLTPVDNLKGIPPAIFEGTLKGLDAKNLLRFYRRVCGSKSAFETFSTIMPERELGGLKEELHAFLPENNIFEPSKDIRFDRAIISEDDTIFPAINQRRAWEGVPCHVIPGGHLPNFQNILNQFVIDKNQTAQKFNSGSKTYDDATPVQQNMVENMRLMMENAGLPAQLCRQGCRILEIGSGTGSLTRVLDHFTGRFGTIESWDLAFEAPLKAEKRFFRKGDAELLIQTVPTASLDFIATASTVQWFNSPTRFLNECNRVLRSGAYLIIGTYCKGNLAEVESVTGVGLPLLTASEWRQLCGNHFLVTDFTEYSETLEFDNATDIFRHLRNSGVNSLNRSDSGISLRKAISNFPTSTDGKYRITYCPVVILMRKR